MTEPINVNMIVEEDAEALPMAVESRELSSDMTLSEALNVKVSGDYSDLANKPQINGVTLEGDLSPEDIGIRTPSLDGYATETYVNTEVGALASNVYTKAEAYSKTEVNTALDTKADESDVYTKSETYTKTEVNTALSGKADKSDIPTVNNASLTIQKNGSTVQTFTANASSDKTANITVPTKTSELNNDSGFLTEHQSLDGYATETFVSDEVGEAFSNLYYGECNATSTSTEFTATIPGITKYKKGLAIMLRNGVVTSASGYTINVNGLGALPVRKSLTDETRDTTLFTAASTYLFIYEEVFEGGDWLMYQGYDSNTNTLGYQIRTNLRTMPVTDQTSRYRILFSSLDGQLVPANTNGSTSATGKKTPNTREFNPFGEILYYNYTTVLQAGSKPGKGLLFQQLTLALGYSFNNTGKALALVADAPVYVKCTPMGSCSAVLDASEPIVQELPTEEDGYIYIYLGTAYSTTNIEMTLNHPVYYFRNGEIKLYTGTMGE